MNQGIYYHIMGIGIVYEKGRGRGKLWKLGERNKLLRHCELWRKLIQCAAREREGTDSAQEAFQALTDICAKDDLPCYKRVIGLKEKLIQSKTQYSVEERVCQELNQMMTDIITKMEEGIRGKAKKEEVYRMMQVLHHFPKRLYGDDEL